MSQFQSLKADNPDLWRNLCVKVEDVRSAGESKPKQEEEKRDEKKSDSDEGAGNAGKLKTNFTQTPRSRQNVQTYNSNT